MKDTELLLARAKRYLKSAQLLIKDEDFESAISRTYYAMFFAVQGV